MNEFSRLSSVARAGLLLVVGLSALGARFCWMNVGGARWFQAHLGYYFVLTLFIVWGVFFAKVATTRCWLTWAYWREHSAALLVVAGVTLFLHLHEPHVMRVLFDEPTHALGALVMHWDKAALMTSQSNYVGDNFVLTGYYASFRQYLFPFLVSLLHDLTGYRVANAFILNFLLTPIILLGGYFLGLKLGGKLAGMITVGLLGGLPLLAQNVTSGGYDVLNVALLGGLMLFTIAYASSAGPERSRLMNLSLATGLLLAVTRTESILYLMPWAVVVLTLWWRERRVDITGFAIVSPVFLMPNLMGSMILMSSEVSMNSGIRNNGEAFFDIRNLPEHVAEAIYYFFNFDRGSTNNLILSSLGLLGSVALLVSIPGVIRARRLRAQEAIVALFTLWTLAVYLFILANFWGSPIDGLATRFCLALMLAWAVVAGWLLVQVKWLRNHPAVVFGGLVVWGVIAAAPMTSRGFVTHNLMTAQAEQWFLGYAEMRDRKTTLYVENSNVTFLAHRYASSRLDYLRKAPEVFIRALKAGLYHDVIVFQTLEGHPTTGEWRFRGGHEVPPDLVLETIDERAISPIYLVRISRLVGYKKEGMLVTPDSDHPDIDLKESFASEAEWHAYRLSLYP